MANRARYLAIEGPIGVGKTSLATRLAERFGGRLVLERVEANPFLVDFYRAYRTGGEDGTGLRKDEALTLARRQSRERGDPAQVWAAWVLVGDAR